MKKKSSNSKAQKKSSAPSRRKRRGDKMRVRPFRPISETNSMRAAPMSLNSGQSVNYSDMAGMSMWEFLPASTPGGMRIRGREAAGTLLATVTTSTNFQQLEVSTVNGVRTVGLPLNPYYLTRLENIADLYEQFKFHQYVVDVIPYKPTSTAGLMFGCVDTDPSEAFDTSSLEVQSEYLSNLINFCSAVYSLARMVYTGDFSQLPRLLTNAVQTSGTEDAASYVLSLQGYARFGCQGVSTTDGDSLASVIVSYDVEFFSPCESLASVPGALSKGDRLKLGLARRSCEVESIKRCFANRLQKIEGDILFLKDHSTRVTRLQIEAEERKKKVEEVGDDLMKTIEKFGLGINPEVEKRKFDPQHSDGDIPNTFHDIYTLRKSGETFDFRNTLSPERHLKVGDGQRWYWLDGASTKPIDLKSTDYVGCLDPFIEPKVGTTFKGCPCRYYPSIERVNFCPCGCNDPLHEERVGDICCWCGSDDGCIDTFDYLHPFQAHERSLDSRCAYRSMDRKEFWNCCLAIWSIVSNCERSRMLYEDFLASELCTVFRCTGTALRLNQVDQDNPGFNCALNSNDHLCCLSPSSLQVLTKLVSSRDFPLAQVKNLDPRPKSPSTREGFQRRILLKLNELHQRQKSLPPFESMRSDYDYDPVESEFGSFFVEPLSDSSKRVSINLTGTSSD